MLYYNEAKMIGMEGKRMKFAIPKDRIHLCIMTGAQDKIVLYPSLDKNEMPTDEYLLFVQGLVFEELDAPIPDGYIKQDGLNGVVAYWAVN